MAPLETERSFRVLKVSYGSYMVVESFPPTVGGLTRKTTPPRRLNMATWKSTMHEDIFPIENGDFPMSC